LYTQFKEKSFIASLGTNGSTLPCEKVFAIQAAQKLRHYSYGSQNIGTSRIREVRPFEGKTLFYSIKYGADAHPIIGFSKTYDDSFNPQSAFAAILTCSQADGACPLLLVLKRIPITFEDQKHLIIHPNKKKNIEKGASKSLRSFLCILK
jgi:hypothetical protein